MQNNYLDIERIQRKNRLVDEEKENIIWLSLHLLGEHLLIGRISRFKEPNLHHKKIIF